MRGIAEKNETICFEYCLDIDFRERINNHMILISQSDLPEFHLMKLKQDLERANRLKTNSKSDGSIPVTDHPFPTHKKIVREILNEIGTFLEAKNFETNDGLIFAIGDTWKNDHKIDQHNLWQYAESTNKNIKKELKELSHNNSFIFQFKNNWMINSPIQK
ncbi:hypothetical protein DERF_001084 [Dermatophagoides farinae]|uniref:Uncharacterized protein n=1 Tax=Dermatophagoides farinae TaxID=6954 RepID=A0A922L911_DERFA|nr:hypothetical protein DERF_001084 [Dermatophagoides farinae]